MSQSILTLWGLLASCLIVAVMAVKAWRRQRLKITLEDFIALALSSLGCISSLHLIYKAFSVEELREILEGDIVTLIIGGLAVLWVSGKEVIRIMLDD
ncbi:MAG: hypothetical protein ACFCVD_18385 [Nodosilinea sp.]